MIKAKIKITSFEQLREYAKAYKLVTGYGIEDEVEEEDAEEETDDSAAPRKQQGKRTPNHKGAAERYKDWEPASSGCLSGSGDEVPQGGRFSKGGQHKLTAIAGAVNAGELDFDKIATHAYQYLLDSGKYPNLDVRLEEALA